MSRPPLSSVLFATTLAVAVPSAFAADPPELDTFRPSPLAVLGATDGLESAPATSVDAGVWFQDDVQSWTTSDGVPVSNRSVITPAAAFHLGFGVAFEAALPLVLQDEGYDPDSNLAWDGAALGRAHIRMRVAHTFGDFRLGIGLAGESPRTELLAGPGGGFLFAPDATVLWGRGPVTIAAAGGARSGWFFARGGVAIGAKSIQVYAESESQGPTTALGTELRVGAHSRFGAVGLDAGVGTALAAVPGQPAARMWVALTLHHRPPPPAPKPVVPLPAPQPVEPAVRLPIQLPGLFVPGAVMLAEDGNDRLYALADYLENNPDLRVRVEAHMQTMPGLDDFAVSQVRADRVRQALVDRGIDASRVEAIGFGSGVYNQDLIEIVIAE